MNKQLGQNTPEASGNIHLDPKTQHNSAVRTGLGGNRPDVSAPATQWTLQDALLSNDPILRIPRPLPNNCRTPSASDGATAPAGELIFPCQPPGYNPLDEEGDYPGATEDYRRVVERVIRRDSGLTVGPLPESVERTLDRGPIRSSTLDACGDTWITLYTPKFYPVPKSFDEAKIDPIEFLFDRTAYRDFVVVVTQGRDFEIKAAVRQILFGVLDAENLARIQSACAALHCLHGAACVANKWEVPWPSESAQGGLVPPPPIARRGGDIDFGEHTKGWAQWGVNARVTCACLGPALQ